MDSDVLWAWMELEPGKRSWSKHPMQKAEEVFAGALAGVRQKGQPPYYVQLNVMEVHEAQRWFGKRGVDPALFKGEPSYEYLQALHLVSGEVDQFVRKLSARPGWRNTLFVITSDHGEGLRDHPNVAASQKHGCLLYESQVVVPLILHNPAGGLPAGKVIKDRVRLLDLMPTLLDYAGIEVPPGLDGRSLMPMLHEDAPVKLPERFVVETELEGFEKIGVYAPVWKYFENRDPHKGTNPIELQAFGAKENGTQTDAAKKHADITSSLRAFVSEWERVHPKVAPSLQGEQISPMELEQLRAIGYIE